MGSQKTTKVVKTASGSVRGAVYPGGVASFIGIPFAEPTSGINRFALPTPRAKWGGVLNCTATSAQYCPQAGGDVGSESEDCLSLSIWTPPPLPSSLSPPLKATTTAPTLLPVLVWIFGGGFAVGSSDDWTLANLTTAGARLGMPTIIVSINYRVSGLGFAALPGLGEGNGNFGLFDQRLALLWLNDNIASFGGDTTKLAIWGQSAGGQSICFHLASHGSAGLFTRAISSSGPCILPYPSLKDAEDAGLAWASRAGCAPSPTSPSNASLLACLRNAPVASIVKAGMPRASPHDGFLYPAIDNTAAGWPGDNADLFEQGKIAKVSCMFGSVDDDLGSSFSKGIVPANVTAADYPKYLRAIAAAVGLGDGFVADLQSNYPLSRRRGSVKATLLDLVGDSNLVCTQRTTAVLAAAAMASASAAATASGPTPAQSFEYSFTYRAWQDGGEAFHASDLPFFFGDSAEFDDAASAFSPEELNVRDSMQRNLLHFVKHGRPASLGWLPVSKDSNASSGVMEFGTNSTVVRSWKQSRCALWQKQRQQTRWLGDSELQRILKNVSLTVLL